MLRAIDRSVKVKPQFKGVFTVQHLSGILKACESYPLPLIYKTAYLFPYFGFLRISNLFPPSIKSFSCKKHLCIGDSIVNSSDLVVVIKWSKTVQATYQGSYIVLPKFANSSLCPWQHFQKLASAYPVHSNLPCFSKVGFLLVEYMLRQHLRNIVIQLGLDPAIYTFHTFRRSGATLAHNLDIPIDQIKRHGTWSSDSVLSYIVDDPQRASALSSSLTRFFNHNMS